MNRGGNSYGFSGFSIGQVERMIGVKAHIVRYWEDQIPLIRPQKDSLGRRFYSARDVSILYRLKYLIYEKHFTALGAGEQLLRELSDKSAAARGEIIIQELRRELIGIYSIVAKSCEQKKDAETVEPEEEPKKNEANKGQNSQKA